MIAYLVLAVAAAAALEVAVPVAAAVPAPAVPVVAQPLQTGASELVHYRANAQVSAPMMDAELLRLVTFCAVKTAENC